MQQFFFTVFMLGVIVGIVGICVSEVILVYALISSKPKVSTRTVGRWILAFLGILIVSATAVMFVMRG